MWNFNNFEKNVKGDDLGTRYSFAPWDWNKTLGNTMTAIGWSPLVLHYSKAGNSKLLTNILAQHRSLNSGSSWLALSLDRRSHSYSRLPRRRQEQKTLDKKNNTWIKWKKRKQAREELNTIRVKILQCALWHTFSFLCQGWTVALWFSRFR